MTPRNIEDQLATAPVTWGVWELTVDRDGLITPDEMLGAANDLGYSAVELGPEGYFGATAEDAATLLAANGQALVGAFVELHFFDADKFEADMPHLDEALDTLIAGGRRGPLLLADIGSPERLAIAGQLDKLDAARRSPDDEAAAAERVMAAARRAEQRGVDVAFHGHAATHFETEAELEALLAATDPDLLGLCIDTGHALVGGIDPVELLRRHASRMTHLHVKDVSGEVLQRLRAGELDMNEAWAQGLFSPFGEGAVDLHAFLSSPELSQFDGWIVLEQDRVTVTSDDLEGVTYTERSNRERVVNWLGAITADAR